MRGNRHQPRYRNASRGSIPACAGEPAGRSGGHSRTTVYPRVCGGTFVSSGAVTYVHGLSPRVRGNRGDAIPIRYPLGSIPACAGEPKSKFSPENVGTVYPRVCGGTCRRWQSLSSWAGLSPRVRGNPRSALLTGWPIGSIPACAGEPYAIGVAALIFKVYPRVCGGTTASGVRDFGLKGLSPRVRGNRLAVNWHQRQSGSIPACAGEPLQHRYRRYRNWVYPRVCGGTNGHGPFKRKLIGLSPRVRGNHIETLVSRCAGEPADQMGKWVYPRVCGGTYPGYRMVIKNAGLSPRVRGNLHEVLFGNV